MDLYAKFIYHLNHDGLVRQDISTLLAVSGGIDSVVMAHLFKRAGWPFGIAHCNFQLRGRESDGDAVFVRELAAHWGVPFYYNSLPTEQFATENGISIQMAARALRYEWFKEVAEVSGFGTIATGHNQDDSVETALHHFIRGTGVDGMRGIPLRYEWVVRPLLFASRTEILAYAQAHQITWREDSSNQSDDYTRNFIRHQIVPKMVALNPSFLDAAEKTMRLLGETGDIAQYFLQKWLKENQKTMPDGSVVFSKMALGNVPHTAHILYLVASKWGFTEDQCRQIGEAIAENAQSGKEWNTEGYRAMLEREQVIFVPKTPALSVIAIEEDDLMVSLPDGSKMFLMPSAHAQLEVNDLDTAFLDADAIKFPLTLRHWLPGDGFRPLGMKGQSQKLQDFFINQKISRLEKEKTWLLLQSSGEIIWVVGHRIDDRVKITEKTVHVLKVHFAQKS